MLIGEVAKRTGVSVRMLRHYDSLGLVSPSGRTSAGYRDYLQADVTRLLHVESLRMFGLSLAAAKHALDEPGFSPATLIDDVLEATRRRIESDRELLGRLQSLRSAAPADRDEALRVVTLLRAVESGSGPQRMRALLGQGGRPPVPVGGLTEALLTEDDPNVAGALRWALDRSPDSAETLANALGEQEGAIRRRAVAALAEISHSAATSALVSVLDDPDPVVRDRAALAAATRGCAETLPVLARMVAEGSHDVEAAETLRSMVIAGTADAGRVVAGLLEYASPEDAAADEETGLRVVQALVEVGGDAAQAALDRFARNAHGVVAPVAAALRGGRATDPALPD